MKFRRLLLILIVIIGILTLTTAWSNATITYTYDDQDLEEWNKTFGGIREDEGYSVQETSDGGYVITGVTFSYGAGLRDLWLVRTDSAGTELWNKTFGGIYSDDGHSVQETRDGGLIIAGGTGSSGRWDIWLIKTDPAGTEIWNKTFGGIYGDLSSSVQETSDGGYVITGETTSYGAGGGDIWLVKTDSAGNKLWDKTFGGIREDGGYSVQETSDGGYVIAGCTYSYGAGYSDVWLVKTDSYGNELWNKTFGGANYDSGLSVHVTSDGGYVIAGYTYSYGAGDSDIWLIKTDSSGTELWNETFGEADTDLGRSVEETSDNGYVITGYTNLYGSERDDDVFLIKTNSAGNEVWKKTFGGINEDDGFSVKQTSDGGYIITGSTNSYGAGTYDAWLIKVGLFENNPPNSPSKPSGPTSGTQGTTCSYTTSATDPDDDQITYTFNWGDGTNSTTGLFDSGATASAAHIWNSSGVYLVRTMATNSKGASSEWSDSLAVSINDPASSTLHYPDFTDTVDLNSWRSWLVLQNPTEAAANVTLSIRSRSGDMLFEGDTMIPPYGVSAIRPRNLVGADCSGSAVIASSHPITGTCQITRNSNEMCMGYNAADHAATTMYYPDFTDTANPESWRSWLVLQNPHPSEANITLEIRSRAGDVLYVGSLTIPAKAVSAVRPRNLAGADCAGSAVITSDLSIVGTCQITRNSNKMCMSYSASDQGSTTLYYPDFTDTTNPDSWRSWLVIQNPSASPANLSYVIRSRAGDILYTGSDIIPAHSVNAIRPRNLAGADCTGSVVVTSDQPIVGTCQITRNNNEMCMSYNALDQGSTTLSYPDFTDTTNPDSWRSWLVLQNPAASAANITLEIRSRAGDPLYTGLQSIPAHGVAAIRPRSLVGSDCTGSVFVTSDQPIVGTCQISRNNNLMCMSYTASGDSGVDWLPPV